MNKSLAIQLKAAFLLFLLSLNMFVGFACSIGLMSGNNAQHHPPKAENKSTHTHSHEHGKTGKGGHHHEKAKAQNHLTDHKDANDKKGCCSDEVQKIQQLDKNINSNGKIIAVDVIADVAQTHYQPYPVIYSTTNPVKLRERFFYPPPPNILLSIQRLQI